MIEVIAPTADYAYASLRILPSKIVALTQSMMSANFKYGLGAKISPLTDQAEDVPPANRRVDCSGFVRWAIFHALGCPKDFDMPDGSFNQHDWANNIGLKHSTFADAGLHDNAVRIAFLAPNQSLDGIGHVVLVINGQTQESHGSHGPDQRELGSKSYHKVMSFYVLTPSVQP